MTPPQIVGLVILGLVVVAIIYVLLFAHTFSSNRSPDEMRGDH